MEKRKSTVNWKGVAILAAGGITVVSGINAYIAGGISLVLAIAGAIALIAMYRAGWNPPADYRRQGLERAVERAETAAAREAAEAALAAYDAEQAKAPKA